MVGLRNSTIKMQPYLGSKRYSQASTGAGLLKAAHLEGSEYSVELRTLSMAQVGKKDSVQAETLQRLTISAYTASFDGGFSLEILETYEIHLSVHVLPAFYPTTGKAPRDDRVMVADATTAIGDT